MAFGARKVSGADRRNSLRRGGTGSRSHGCGGARSGRAGPGAHDRAVVTEYRGARGLSAPPSAAERGEARDCDISGSYAAGPRRISTLVSRTDSGARRVPRLAEAGIAATDPRRRAPSGDGDGVV